MVSRRSWVEQVMGLPISVLARGGGAGSRRADAAVREVFAELVEADRVFSPYRADSAVSLLARGATSWDRVDPVVREVAERCVAARELTGGLFDADVPGGTWDPSGLVKGWAVERAREVVDVDWCLNAGGDVLVLSPSDGCLRGRRRLADQVAAGVRGSGCSRRWQRDRPHATRR